MTVNPKSKSTATKENALDSREVDEFLNVRQDARMATNRGDGWWHLTPIWYLWDGTFFYHTLGSGRRHLQNLRKDPHVTLCVDEDARLQQGPDAGARSIVCFGVATLSTDDHVVENVTRSITERYLGAQGLKYLDALLAEGRTIITVRPQRWLTWDYNKD